MASLRQYVKKKRLEGEASELVLSLGKNEEFWGKFEPGARGEFANIGMRNWLDNKQCPHRCPAYPSGDGTKIYLAGGNWIMYDPVADKVIRQPPKPIHSFDLDDLSLSLLDMDLIRSIHEKVHGLTFIPPTSDEVDIEVYKISTKRKTLTEKQRRDIYRYEQAKGGVWKKHSG